MTPVVSPNFATELQADLCLCDSTRVTTRHFQLNLLLAELLAGLPKPDLPRILLALLSKNIQTLTAFANSASMPDPSQYHLSWVIISLLAPLPNSTLAAHPPLLTPALIFYTEAYNNPFKAQVRHDHI